MSASPDRLERMEQELSQAIEGMEEALDHANGTCSKKIKRRTTKVRRSIMKLAEEGSVEQ